MIVDIVVFEDITKEVPLLISLKAEDEFVNFDRA